MNALRNTSTAILYLLLGIAAPAYAQHEQQDQKQDHPPQQQSKHEQAKPEKQHAQQPQKQKKNKQTQQHVQQQQKQEHNQQTNSMLSNSIGRNRTSSNTPATAAARPK